MLCFFSCAVFLFLCCAVFLFLCCAAVEALFFLSFLLGWLVPLGAALCQLRGEAPGRHVRAFWAPGALRLRFPALGAAQFIAILWPASGMFCGMSCGLSCGHLVATSCQKSCGPAFGGRSGCPILWPYFGRWTTRSATKGSQQTLIPSRKFTAKDKNSEALSKPKKN